MYLPTLFAEERPDVLHALIKTHPFGTLVTMGDDGLHADHIPFLLDPAVGTHGTLRAHVARANPLWERCSGSRESAVEPLVIFQGPQAYVSPNWYATKREHGKVVPTWNYMVVHAYGPVRVIEDPQWLRLLLENLTDTMETGQLAPWKVDDAPPDFIAQLLKVIVGIEIPITRLVGKWKVSQNQPEVNRAGVISGLQSVAGENALGMVEAMKNR